MGNYYKSYKVGKELDTGDEVKSMTFSNRCQCLTAVTHHQWSCTWGLTTSIFAKTGNNRENAGWSSHS